MILGIIIAILVIIFLGKILDFIWDGIGCMFIGGIAIVIFGLLAYAVFSIFGML